MNQEQLEEALQSMGMASFVKYYRQFSGPTLFVEDIVALMIANGETWSTKLPRAGAVLRSEESCCCATV